MNATERDGVGTASTATVLAGPSYGVFTRVKLAVVVLIFGCLLVSAYRDTITVVLRSQGYRFNDVSLLMRAAAIMFSLGPLLWLDLTVRRPTQIVFILLYMSVYVPCCLFPMLAGAEPPAKYLMLDVWLLAGFFVISSVYRLPLWKIPKPQLSSYNAGALLLGVTLVSCAVIVAEFGFVFKIHSFENVYDTRLDMREEVTSKSTLARYLLNWLKNVLIPCSFILALHNRRWWVLGIAVFLQCYLYSVTALKGTLFYLPLVLVLYCVTPMLKRSVFWGLAAPAVATGLFLAVDAVRDGSTLTILFLRRQFMNPGIMLANWFDFFYQSPKAMLGHSFMGSVVDYPYDLSPGRLVGEEMYGVVGMNACGNLFADGYANFGYIGVIGVSLLLGAVLHAYDSLAAKSDFRLAATVLFLPALMLSDSGVFTTLLTHGLGLVFLVAIVLPAAQSSPQSAANC
ncbi:O-antigen polymerase [Roseimaritima sediminicola]|uniref:O-antigen polymerase n=1 Tax=Roseimaritima sediminicola TaxID=2662066 RepID=UPI00129854FF|nr:O-antigen polymerase [Roseimaritima sediminicola]